MEEIERILIPTNVNVLEEKIVAKIIDKMDAYYFCQHDSSKCPVTISLRISLRNMFHELIICEQQERKE